MSDASPDISVLVPCFNEKGAIAETVAGLHRIFGDRDDWELIVIDDGSNDGSEGVLLDMEGLTVLRHDTNRGYGAALKTGLRHARGQWIVITDADGTYPNECIPELLKLAEGADMAVGARTGSSVHIPWTRGLAKTVLRGYCQWIANREIPDMNSGLRVFRADVARTFLRLLPNSFSFTTTITLAMLTNDYQVRYLPIDYAPRIGRSKIQPIRDTLRFFQLIVRMGMYFAPVRAFAPLILVLAMGLAVCLGLDIAEDNLTDKTLIFLMLTINAGLFALLADLIAKRSGR